MDIQAVRDLAARLREQTARVVVGQGAPVDLLTVALLAQGGCPTWRNGSLPSACPR